MTKKVDYHSLMFEAPFENEKRLTIGIPMTGIVRSEWVVARYNQVIPCNWSQHECLQWVNSMVPLRYAVSEARNIIVHEAIQRKSQWLLFIDHDTMPPPDTFVKLNQYMMKGDIPVVCGLYYAKCHPPEPLLFRGRGTGCFTDFVIGDKVWVDGIPMGLTLINVKILAAMYEDAEPYKIGDKVVRRVFDTPFGIKQMSKGNYAMYAGTEDLAWCSRVMAGKYLEKAGFPKIQKKQYPFLCDTSLFCKHITMDGKIYPLGEPNRPKVKRGR
jgi:hypothetical protein